MIAIGRKQVVAVLLVGAAMLATVQPSQARGRGRHYHRGGGGFRRRGYGGGGGGYLSGVASVINAQGKYLINTQRAYYLKEQVRAAQMQNRQRAFDEHLYEKSLRPTLNDKRVLAQQQELRRALTHPPETEIWSGKSLNDLLMNITDLRSKGTEVPDVSLNPDNLKQINLTVREDGNIGLLKDAGRLNWPQGLQMLEPQTQTAALRKQIDALLPEGKKQASTAGRVDAHLVAQLETNVGQLRDLLVDQVSEFSFGDYTHAKNYLTQLSQAIKILKLPDVANYFNGKYQPQGNSIEELTQYMTENGLKFAPAIPGEESAYSGLFAAMAQYYLGSGSTVPSESATRNFYSGLYRQTRMYQTPIQGRNQNPFSFRVLPNLPQIP